MIAICFLIISIINVPLYIIYAVNNTGSKLGSIINNYLFKTTISNIASSIFNYKLDYINCETSPSNEFMKGLNTLTSEHTFKLDCGDYNFDKVNQFGLSKSSSDDATNKRKCIKFQYKLNLQLNEKCSNNLDLFNAISDTTGKCDDVKVCNFSVKLIDFYKNCKDSIAESNLVYLSYTCKSNILNKIFRNKVRNRI
jgi:hypothetical protein